MSAVSYVGMIDLAQVTSGIRALCRCDMSCVGNSYLVRINGCQHKTRKAYIRYLQAERARRKAHLNELL